MIRCTQCERGRAGPVYASKIHTDAGEGLRWYNRARCCGSLYPAMPPGAAGRRSARLKERRRLERLERSGQLRLFNDKGAS